jgi:hypothetical protein
VRGCGRNVAQVALAQPQGKTLRLKYLDIVPGAVSRTLKLIPQGFSIFKIEKRVLEGRASKKNSGLVKTTD